MGNPGLPALWVHDVETISIWCEPMTARHSLCASMLLHLWIYAVETTISVYRCEIKLNIGALKLKMYVFEVCFLFALRSEERDLHGLSMVVLQKRHQTTCLQTWNNHTAQQTTGLGKVERHWAAGLFLTSFLIEVLTFLSRYNIKTPLTAWDIISWI